MSYDDDEGDEEFTVFLSHGRNLIWKEVKRYIERELEINVITLISEINRGRSVLEKLEEETEVCHFAVIIMTAEDEQANGQLRARQNVVHELGFCQGKFGRNNVLVLRQDELEEFSNMFGIIYESFRGGEIKTTFRRIKKELHDGLERFLQPDDDDDQH